MRVALYVVLTVTIAACASQQASIVTPLTATLSFVAIDSTARQVSAARSVDFDRFTDIYVLSSNALTKYSWNGDSLRAITGLGSGHYEFNDPVDLDTRFPNTVLVADRLNHRVEIYSRDLTYLGTIYTRDDPDRNRRFGYPRAAVADRSGNIFVLDGENHRIVKFRSDRTYERTFGGYAESTRPDAVLSEPSTIAVDDVGNLIVLDQQGKSLVTYDNFGSYITRQKLPVACSRIAVTADTIVLLSTERASQTSTGAQGQYLRLSSPTLVRLGDLDELRFSTRRPEESQIDIIPRRPVVDFAISGSKGVLIDGQFLEHLRLIPIAESPKPQ